MIILANVDKLDAWGGSMANGYNTDMFRYESTELLTDVWTIRAVTVSYDPTTSQNLSGYVYVGVLGAGNYDLFCGLDANRDGALDCWMPGPWILEPFVMNFGESEDYTVGFPVTGDYAELPAMQLGSGELPPS